MATPVSAPTKILRIKRLGTLVTLVLAVIAAGIPAVRATAVTTADTAESWRLVTGGARDYWLYIPAGAVPPSGRPMVMYLHGCTQNNATDPPVAFGTRWNELAARVGAVVVYPLQAAYNDDDPAAVEGNGASCWNWFLPQNMHRGQGEPALLSSLARDVAVANQVDATRVFVMGVSAGADMANVLGITYPDVFRASAMFAGCAYDACRDVSGDAAATELAAQGRAPRPAIIFQGDADTLNNLALGQTLHDQQIGMRHISKSPRTVENHGNLTQPRRPGSGNPCVGPHNNYPCAAGLAGWGSYPYTVKRYADATGRTAVEWWVIHGLNHNYPSGDYRATYTDPAGPDITAAAWNFFTAA